MTIPNSVTTIDDWAFSGCSSLKSVTIPNSVVRVIGRYAFGGCSSLTSVTISNSVTIIGDGAFYRCTSLRGATIPNSVTVIGSSAFGYCSSLTSVTIPDSVTTIDDGAFGDCSSLMSMPIPDSVTIIGSDVFSGCSSLTSVTIPDSVTRIGKRAFRECSSLTGVTIPNRVTIIGDRTFDNCSSLTSVIIPNSVKYLRLRAFRDCSSLISIVVASGNPKYASEDGVLFDLTKTTLIHCPGGKAGAYSIPNSVTTIDYRAFSGCSRLTSVTIPDRATAIDYGAFEGCSSLAKATFLGHAPIYLGGGGIASALGLEPWITFSETAPDFTIYYLSSSTGFTSPEWRGFPTVMIDEATYPAASWLLRHDLPHDTDLHNAASLLMAYAFDFDPNGHMTPGLPEPLIDPVTGTLRLTFYAASSGITYAVETSTDLQNWASDGVALSELGEDGLRTALINRDGPDRFMRLVVED